MKKGISMVLAITLAIGTSAPAMAQPMSKSEYQKTVNLYNQAQDKLEKLNESVEKLDNDIQNTMIEIDNINKKIEGTKTAINNIEDDIQAAEKDIQEKQKVFGDRMEAMYMNGPVSYLDVLLDSESFSDLISRLDTVKTLIQFDQGVINELKAKKQEITEKKQELVNEKNNLLALQSNANEKLDKLNKSKADQRKLIAQVKAQSSTYASDINEYKEFQKKALLSITKMKKTYAVNTSSKSKSTSISSSSSASSGRSQTSYPSRGSVNVTGGDIVDYAARFIGVPYVWGGTSPSGFDCSGFTQYVYRQFGISISRTSSAQAGNGVPVSKSDLKPGDLVFFGSPVHHVGIYIGNGAYIHAPQTGDSVKISDLSRRSDYVGARRILN